MAHLLKVADALGQSRALIFEQADKSGIRSDIVAAIARGDKMPVPVSQTTMEAVNTVARKRKQVRGEYIRTAIEKARLQLAKEANEER